MNKLKEVHAPFGIHCHYRLHPVYRDYIVTEDGNIYSMLQKRGALKPKYNKKANSLEVSVTYRNKPKAVLVKRLIAEALIPNPLNLPCVRLHDGDYKNTNVNNLYWSKHHTDGCGGGITAMAIRCTSPEGVELAFPSQTEAALELGLDQGHVSKALSGKCTHVKNYTFEKVEI